VDAACRELDGDVRLAPANWTAPCSGAIGVMLDGGDGDCAGWEFETSECAGDSLGVAE
jgi:hypothetical protein